MTTLEISKNIEYLNYTIIMLDRMVEIETYTQQFLRIHILFKHL